MKKILSAIVAFGLLIAPVNTFGQSLSVTKSLSAKKNNQGVGIIAAILTASALLTILIISSSNDDKPVSP